MDILTRTPPLKPWDLKSQDLKSMTDGLISKKEAQLWEQVARTVQPLALKRKASLPRPISEVLIHSKPEEKPITQKTLPPLPSHNPLNKNPKDAQARVKPSSPKTIEPRRKRQITRSFDISHWQIDLHGLNQSEAKKAVFGFLRHASLQGQRAVLVVTGKGVDEMGILRQQFPAWLEDPEIAPLIAGISSAARQHGGRGAFYVALKSITKITTKERPSLR